MTDIDIGQGPADFRFKVVVADQPQLIVVNYYAIHAQMRLDGYEFQSQLTVDKAYVESFVKAVRATTQPATVVAGMSDADLYAKGNEAFMLFDQLGNEPGLSPTSRQPTDASMSLTG